MGVYVARYLATQIRQLKIKYSDAVQQHPKEKSEIDKCLKEDGFENLIEKDK